MIEEKQNLHLSSNLSDFNLLSSDFCPLSSDLCFQFFSERSLGKSLVPNWMNDYY